MDLRAERDWIILPGKTLKEIETIAIRSCYLRCNGVHRAMQRELRISRSNLMRKLDKLGLRKTGKGTWRLTENDLARRFFLHCKTIAVEMNISESTLLKWLNKRAPFPVATPPPFGIEEK